MVAEAGGSAYLVGVASGGALALEAAHRLAGVRGVALYEVPFITDPEDAAPADFDSHMRALVPAGRRSVP